MMKQRLRILILSAAVVSLPGLLSAQDPSMNPGSGPYPPSSPGLNQPSGSGINPQTGMPNSTGQNSQPASMRDSLGAPGLTGQQMVDKQFVRDAAEASIADEELGKLATTKGSATVQTLAQKLVDDHTSMSRDLSAVADSMAIMLPHKMNKDHQREYDKLNGLSGKDFDTEYLTYTATAHYQDLHAFHMEASVASNDELATEVVKEMGTMHRHLGLIQSAAKEDGVALPPRPERPNSSKASK